jgi:hypothetical protein
MNLRTSYISVFWKEPPSVVVEPSSISVCHLLNPVALAESRPL